MRVRLQRDLQKGYEFVKHEHYEVFQRVEECSISQQIREAKKKTPIAKRHNSGNCRYNCAMTIRSFMEGFL